MQTKIAPSATMKTLLHFAILLILAPLRPSSGDEARIRSPGELMMKITYLLVGTVQRGTGFFIGVPLTNGSTLVALVSADHLFRTNKNDILVQNRKETANGWITFKTPLTIRDEGKELWYKHPRADVGVMKVDFSFRFTPWDVLIDDGDIRRFNFSPGTQVMILGYPFGYSPEYGFGVIKSGRVSSYPLIPTKDRITFLCDFNTFPGHSGGPVFVYEQNPTIDESLTLGGNFFRIVGLQIQNIMNDQLSLSLSVNVHASIIREALEMIPEVRDMARR